MRVARLEPVCAEVEERYCEDYQEQRAVDAGSVEEVCAGQEEQDVYWRRVGATWDVLVRIDWDGMGEGGGRDFSWVWAGESAYRKTRSGTQLRRQNILRDLWRVAGVEDVLGHGRVCCDWFLVERRGCRLEVMSEAGPSSPDLDS